ncbi:MAG: tetratricopeptide repeat protein [Acidobacteriota bacterium]
MPAFKNRIGFSLLVILAGTCLWEFYARPATGPIFAAAVSEYRNHNYRHSLQLLDRAYQIDPNNASVLTLMGWDNLKTRRPDRALEEFSRAHRLAPDSADAILGYADTEITLEHYGRASKLLRLIDHERDDSADLDMAWGDLYQLTGRNQKAAREFERVLALRHNDRLALENLRELEALNGAASPVGLRPGGNWRTR